MTNKKTYKDPEGYDKVRKLFEDAGLVDIYSEKEKKGIISSHKRIKYKVLKKAGKIGLLTTVLYFLLSSWKSLIGKAFGKVIVISTATTITVGGGYYVVKKVILSPQPKKIEKNAEKKIQPPDKKVKKVKVALKPGFYFQFDKKGSNISKSERLYFENHIYKYLFAKETKNFALIIKIAKLENIYSVSMTLQDIKTLKVVESKGAMVRKKHNAAKECKKYAMYFRKKYLQ